ncbi:MAG: amidohydrolase [Nocardioidaceae bacterium]
MRAVDVAALKGTVRAAIEARADDLVEVSADLAAHPETGFREEYGAGAVGRWFDSLGLPHECGLARTGVKARMTGALKGPTVAVLGELDALYLPSHRDADPETGAAHACGHHAQVAAMLGAGIGLAAVRDALDGDVVLFAVPAEETVQLDWRQRLVADGELRHTVGKAELVSRGHFDDVDLAMMCHTGADDGHRFTTGDTLNGAVTISAVFVGRSSHAGAAPWDGVNALKSATLALAAIDAQRDTFRDEDAVRVSSVITHGGDAPTAVPARAEVQTVVRARTHRALSDACATVRRALRAGAVALGTTVRIESRAGYLPLEQDVALVDLARRNATHLYGAGAVGNGWHRSASTDMGDLGAVMPVLHPFTSGAKGTPHSDDYRVVDHRAAAVDPAVLLAWCVVDLLTNGAALARQVLTDRGDRLSTQDFDALRFSLDASELHDETSKETP